MRKARYANTLMGPVDYFGSGLINPTPEQSIDMAKTDGTYLELFANQDKKLIPVSLNYFDCEACAILGQRGQGKSNTVSRILEQIIPKGIGCTILDIEGEYYGLKSKFEVICVGAGNNRFYDTQLDQVDADTLADFAVKNSTTVILDFSDVSDEARVDFVNAYVKALLAICGKLKNENRPKQHILVVEEVQSYAPEDGISITNGNYVTGGALKNSIRRIAQTGRKRGIGLIIASQRTTAIDKTLLSQCTSMVLHKVSLPNDLAIYDRLIGGDWTTSEKKDMFAIATPGDAIVRLGDMWHAAHILPQDTVHLGYSPKANSSTSNPFEAYTIDKTLITKILTASKKKADSKKSPYQTEVDVLKDQVVKHERTIDILRSEKRITDVQVKALKNITVSLNEDVIEKLMNSFNTMQDTIIQDNINIANEVF